MNACSIIAKNYIAYARVLARSFTRHNPDGHFSVLVIDDLDGYVDANDEPFELLTPGDIDCDEFAAMALRYDVLELSTAVKPWLLRSLLKRGAPTITYLDPDIEVFGSLARLDQLAVEHGLVLTPHNTVPIPSDGERPTQVDIMVAGVFNLGYMTISAGAEADQLLDWWSERLLRDCRVDPVYGYFVDQRWMDLIPGLVADYAVMRDPEFNVAYWNLHTRDLQFHGDRYTVDGRPLGFFHFSGFDPDAPGELSRHQTRVRVTEHPALMRICRDYANALNKSGHQVARSWPYGYGSLLDGTPFSGLLRRLFRDAEERGELHAPPVDEPGHHAFLEWLKGQDEDAPPGVTRVWAGLYRMRQDLQTTFPDIHGAHREAYLEWARETGVTEAALPPELAPLAELTTGSGPASSSGPPPTVELPFGVNVVGYFRSELGVGEAARQVVSALDAAGVSLLPVHGRTIPLNRQGHSFTHLDPGDARYPLNLICMNADALPEFARQAGPQFFGGRYSIGLWFWEISSPPPGGWNDAFAVLDEVWAPSHHVARVISSLAPIPVVRIPLPIEVPQAAPLPRYALDLPEEDFVFLFSFDYRSVFERKNPLSLVEAFKAAFEPGSGATLVLKCINAESDPKNRARLHAAVRDRQDVRLIEQYLSPDAKNSLMAACDCYVSLHRSEGFGLTMAESMFLGKPVIATGYSGNVDFMTPWNSYLVDFELVPIGADAAPYPPEGEWAQPSIEHATALMREVFEKRSEALERGQRAAADVRRSHSAEAAGAQMVQRLLRTQARAKSDRRSAFAPGASVPELARRVERGPMPARPGNRPRKLARSALLRAIKPFTAHQLAVNSEVLRQLDSFARGQIALQSEQLRLAREALAREGASRAHLSELRYRLDDLGPIQNASIERIDDLTRRLATIEAERQAIPFMQGQPFFTSHHPVAGAVVGYTAANGAGSGEGYREFEDLFRGSEEFIRDRQRRYLSIIGDRQPVLDFGCGRGELLDLLRERGLSYRGVDTDEGMVARCHAKGHVDVVHADGLEYLRHLPDASLGVLFAAQVIEHLTEQQLRQMLKLARRKLTGDGILIVETVNPHSAPAMKTFWVDLTHQHPIFPEVALELCREAGFGSGFFFFPNGSGDAEHDRFVQGEFAVVANMEAGSLSEARAGRAH